MEKSTAKTDYACRLSWQRLTTSISGLGAITIADQVVVSGIRFVTTVIMGRTCGPTQLGAYSVGFAFLVFGGCFVDSLLARPYSVYIQKREGHARQSYAGSTLAQLGLLAIGGSVVVLSIVPAFGEELMKTLLVVSCVLPFSVAWEYSRKISFAHLRMDRALLIDVAMAAIQLSLLAVWVVRDQLSEITVFLTIGISTGVVAVGWIARSISSLKISKFPKVRVHWLRNWAFGRWLLAAQLVGLLHGYSITWTLIVLSDTKSVGIFAAADTIVLLTNPALISFGNLIGPLFARSVVRDGVSAFTKLVSIACGGIATVMTLFALTVGFFGEQIMSFFFGSEFGGYENVMAILAVSPIFWAMTIVFSAALAAIHKPKSTFVGACCGTICTTILAIPLVHFYNVLGGAVAMLIGSFTASSVLAAMLLFQLKRVVKESDD